MIHRLGVFIWAVACLFFFSHASEGAGEDLLLEGDKRAYQRKIELADKKLEAAKKAHQRAIAAAKAQLIKSYKLAIKRAMRQADLKLANKLDGERKALEAGQADNAGKESEAGGASTDSLPVSVKWVDRIGDHVRNGMTIGRYPNKDLPPLHEFLKFLPKAKPGNAFKGFKMEPISASPEGNFTNNGYHTTVWYVFYLKSDTRQTVEFTTLGTAGKTAVFQNGKPVGERTGKLRLAKGANTILISYACGYGRGAPAHFYFKIQGKGIKEGVVQGRRRK
ncbi:MAG: hypothetical protein R3236_05955 [Phycisphaeraceae bacterium]|nr:hypothetical protein [Phycisphaeraceae bacterium]